MEVNMAKSVKLADIAKELGVSTVTVSNALLGKKGVSDKMRELIWKKAQEMGYVKSAMMALQPESTGHFCIGILISEKYLDNKNSFYWQVYKHLAALISKKGYVTMLEIISGEDERNAQMPNILPLEKLDGIIVIGKMEKQYLLAISHGISVPGLCLGFYLSDLEWDAVMADNYDGMYALTNYMITEGNRNLAFVGRIMTSDRKMNRYMGFSKALMEHGISRKEHWMFLEEDLEIEYIARKLVQELPDGVLCVDDQTAEQLISIFQKLNITVPEDISVTGYDNFCFDWIIHSRLTTYEVDAKAMTEEALKILVKKMMGLKQKKSIRIIEGKLIVRDSVKKRKINEL